MSADEIEVKFRVADGPTLERKLIAHGFHRVTPRTFEKNVLFDTPDRRLRAQQSILRIRQYGERWVITHKALPKNNDPAARHKHRIETETQVTDGDAMSVIFSQLGYTPAFTYEKWRTEWSDGKGYCVVDETPVGNFAELEGESAWIDRVAAKLDVPHSEYMTLSYGRLFELWRDEHHSSAEHLTFEAVGAAAR